jgi:cephalosporin-C deacetylase-like acetyl esterase
MIMIHHPTGDRFAAVRDVLASLPKVDIERLGYVGHDFGGYVWAILASLDKRLKTFV